jgi:hypothetical protein
MSSLWDVPHAMNVKRSVAKWRARWGIEKRREGPLSIDDVLTILQQEVASCGSIRAWAMANGFEDNHVMRVLNKRSQPGPRLLTALGLRMVPTFHAVKGDGRAIPMVSEAIEAIEVTDEADEGGLGPESAG